MRIGPVEILVRKYLPPLASTDERGGWRPIVRESWAGAFQSNVTVTLADTTQNAIVFACVSLIASDIAKMQLRLVAQDSDGIWAPTENSAYSPVLRKPNHYQNRIEFVESWLVSKLLTGNTYILKQRNNANKIAAMYILDPLRVRPLVAPDGAVYYELKRDDISGLADQLLIVPASEMIHDKGLPLYHPLVGVSPIHACGVSAVQGLRIQENSTNLFSNGSMPGGVLTAPGSISEDTAARLKAYWDAAYTGTNVGKVAVLGDGLKYEKMAINADDAQLIEQLKWTGENICTAYRVPPYMVGVGPPPNYNNIEALNQQYYSQCLQEKIERIELLLDEGLELIKPYGTEFDIEDLLRMDSATKMTTAANGIKGGIYTPNDGRKIFNKKPLPGGDTVYLQEQDHSLEWLSRRDAETPAAPSAPAAPVAPQMPEDMPDAGAEMMGDENAKFAAALLTKVARLTHAA